MAYRRRLSPVAVGTASNRPKGSFASAEVCRQTGLTYRQLDYWCKKGVITPSVARAFGSGTARCWSKADIKRIKTLLKRIRRARKLLTAAGFGDDCRNWL